MPIELPGTPYPRALMRNAARAVVLLAALLHAGPSPATMCFRHEIVRVTLGPHGQLLVTGTFGHAVSQDLGGHWSPRGVAAPPGEPLPGRPSAPGDDQYLLVQRTLYRAPAFDLPFERYAVMPDTGEPPYLTDAFNRNVVRDGKGRLVMCAEDRQRVVWYDPVRGAWEQSRKLDRSSQTVDVELRGDGTAREALEIRDLNGKLVERRAGDATMSFSYGPVSCDRVAAANGKVFAFGAEAVFSSLDGGKSWFGAPLPKLDDDRARQFRNVFADDAGVLYTNVATPAGLRIAASRDRGVHWKTLAIRGLDDAVQRDQVLATRQGADLYILTGDDAGGRHRMTQVWRVRTDTLAATRLPALPPGFVIESPDSIDANASGTVAVAIVNPDGSDSRVLVGSAAAAAWTAIPGERVTDRDWVRCN